LNNSVQADTKFFRRILVILVLLTIAAGGMVGLTTAQATTDTSAACTVACQ
jgi:heme A synthase